MTPGCLWEVQSVQNRQPRSLVSVSIVKLTHRTFNKFFYYTEPNGRFPVKSLYHDTTQSMTETSQSFQSHGKCVALYATRQKLSFYGCSSAEIQHFDDATNKIRQPIFFLSPSFSGNFLRVHLAIIIEPRSIWISREMKESIGDDMQEDPVLPMRRAFGPLRRPRNWRVYL